MGGLEIVVVFLSGLGWVLLPFFSSRSKVQVHPFPPCPLSPQGCVSGPSPPPRARLLPGEGRV